MALHIDYAHLKKKEEAIGPTVFTSIPTFER